LTGTVAGDVVSGIFTVIGPYMYCGISFSVIICIACGILISPVIYATQRRKYLVYAKAVGWTYIVSLGVLCFVYWI